MDRKFPPSSPGFYASALVEEKIVITPRALVFDLDNPRRLPSGLVTPVFFDNRTFILDAEDWRDLIDAMLCTADECRMKPEFLVAVDSLSTILASAVGYRMGVSVFAIESLKKAPLAGIEGRFIRGKAGLLIANHISMGEASIKAATAVRRLGGKVDAVLAPTGFDLPITEKRLKAEGLYGQTLVNFQSLIDFCYDVDIVSEYDKGEIEEWVENPTIERRGKIGRAHV